MTESVLVVDDEKLIRWTLRECLQQAGYEASEAASGEEALQALREQEFDAVLLDYKLPDMTGLDLLRDHAEHLAAVPVVVITAHSNVENAVDAMKAGASDYVAKPFRNEDILLRLSKVLENSRMRRELMRLRSAGERNGGDGFVGNSPAIRKVFALVDRILDSGDSTILIEGESGTGKDVLARYVHRNSPRRDGPYMNVTCTALPETLLESELFGHEKGAFTDARTQKKGLVELADGGTLFLDEIGDMSMYLQGKILRFLEEKTFRRVGGDRDHRVSLRVIAATNRNLKQLVRDNKFREDLYFRLKVIPIHLPPLRERHDDIPGLVEHFVAHYNVEFKKNVEKIGSDLMRRLQEYHWPGNIRELRNTIERAMILSRGPVLDGSDLPLDLFDDSPADAAAGSGRLQITRDGVNLEELEKDLVRQALQLSKGNQTKAGRMLGLNRDQVRYRIEKFGLTRAGDE